MTTEACTCVPFYSASEQKHVLGRRADCPKHAPVQPPAPDPWDCADCGVGNLGGYFCRWCGTIRPNASGPGHAVRAASETTAACSPASVEQPGSDVQPPAPDPDETPLYLHPQHVVHNHPPYRPTCAERTLPDGRLRGACMDDPAPVSSATTGGTDEAGAVCSHSPRCTYGPTGAWVEGCPSEAVGELSATLSQIDNEPRTGTYQRQAERLLASDWLAARDARTRANAGREAVLAAAKDFQINTWADVVPQALATKGLPALAVSQALVDWLRAFADQHWPEEGI